MKSLDQIEPRRCINDLPGAADAVHVITEPGSYFLAADVVGEQGKHGIAVRLAQDTPNDRVSIDLGGFSLLGVPGSLDGLHVVSPPGTLYEEVTIKPIRLELAAISDWGGDGVHVVRGHSVGLAHVRVVNCAGDGVHLQECTFSKMLDLACEDNGGHGLHANQVTVLDVDGLWSSGNDGDGLRSAPAGNFAGIGGYTYIKMVNTASSVNGGNGATVETACGGNEDVQVEFRFSLFAGNTGHGIEVLNGTDAAGIFCSAKFDCVDVLSCQNGLDGVHVRDVVVSRMERVECIGNGASGLDGTVSLRDANEGFFDIAASRFSENIVHGAMMSSSAPDPKSYVSSSSACNNGAEGFRTEGLSGSSYTRCFAGGNAGSGFAKSFQPGQPVYGNITFEHCRGEGNGLHGLHVLSSSEVDLSVALDSSECSKNGQVGVGDGVLIETPDAGIGVSGALVVSGVDLTVAGNAGDGLRVRSDHNIAMNSVRNMKAVANGGSGGDFGPNTAGLQLSDVAVDFEDVFCSANGSSGLTVRANRVSTAHCRLEGNTLWGAEYTGCDLDSDSDTISDNDEGGLRVTNGGGLRIHEMVCLSNGAVGGGGGIDVFDCFPTTYLSGCSVDGNTGNGLTASAQAEVRCEDTSFSSNTGGGVQVDSGGLVCGSTSHFLRCTADGNGADGVSVLCGQGGQVTECHAHRNGGAGIRVGEGPNGLVTAMQVDRCHASHNAEGIVVDDIENVLLRSMATSNPIGNLRVAPGSHSGPSATFGGTETKPYDWP